MKTALYCLWDKKTQVFSPPMPYHNDHHATRQLSMEYKRSEAMVQFPEDFDLMCVGSFDDRDGQVEAAVPPRLVCCISALVPQEKQ